MDGAGWMRWQIREWRSKASKTQAVLLFEQVFDLAFVSLFPR